MKPVVDFFHPGYKGWAEIVDEPPEAVVKALPSLEFGQGLTTKFQELPFYPGAKFLILKHPSWAPSNLFVYALCKGDEVVWLNGTSPGIHKFNASGHLQLTKENALHYLHFFCFFVRGEEGPFYVANTAAAPYLPNEIGAPAKGTENKLRTIFEQRYQSPRYFGVGAEGEHRISAIVMYSNAIFVADFELKPDGMVQMKNDTPVLADLPTKIDAPLVPPTRPQNTLH